MMAVSEVQLIIREFETLTEAHSLAGQMPIEGLRWIDISATSRGSWVCAQISDAISREDLDRWSEKFQLELLSVREETLKALLSLGPKPELSTQAIGIIEGESIAQVLRTSDHFLRHGLQLLEIRIKRAGAKPGAYAFFALQSLCETNPPGSNLLAMTEVPLVGDYRRFFL